jgi:hypothetical protein
MRLSILVGGDAQSRSPDTSRRLLNVRIELRCLVVLLTSEGEAMAEYDCLN